LQVLKRFQGKFNTFSSRCQAALLQVFTITHIFTLNLRYFPEKIVLVIFRRGIRWNFGRRNLQNWLFMSPGKGSFQLLRKLRENFPLQETRFVMALRFKNPDSE
jgi:hypothetical protein